MRRKFSQRDVLIAAAHKKNRVVSLLPTAPSQIANVSVENVWCRNTMGVVLS